ncbi:MAG: hypothetical protein DCF30_15690 [Hyphomicrobiales bacterium]|nr:MAG: hypothetical protein DCF30_15690 [Hyphomicrobiales bacterium]
MTNHSVATSDGNSAVAVLVSAGLVASVGVVTISVVEIGPLSLQMLQHLAVMNIVARLVSLGLGAWFATTGPHAIWIAGLLQLLLLWAWRAPAVKQATGSSRFCKCCLSVC